MNAHLFLIWNDVEKVVDVCDARFVGKYFFIAAFLHK